MLELMPFYDDMTIVHVFFSFDGEFTSDSPLYITRTGNGKLLKQQNLISFLLVKKNVAVKKILVAHQSILCSRYDFVPRGQIFHGLQIAQIIVDCHGQGGSLDHLVRCRSAPCLRSAWCCCASCSSRAPTWDQHHHNHRRH